MNRFDLHTLADHLHAILLRHEADLRLEQAVYGLDSLREVNLHAMLATGLAHHYEVAREVHYPSTTGRKRSHRARCDLALTSKGFPLQLDTRPADLFTPAATAQPQEALWIEIKAAWQYREGGVRHAGYGAQWRNAVVSDLVKMEQDPLIEEAVLLLVVFNESQQVLAKDLDLFELVLAEKEVLAGFRQVRSITIQDRIGHNTCTVAIWPTVQRGQDHDTRPDLAS
jgi:hypothetical protein